MSKTKAKMAAPTRDVLAELDELRADVTALRKTVADILGYPPLAGHVYAIAACERQAQWEQERRAKYEAAAPERAAALSEWANAALVVHPGIGLEVAGGRQVYTHWSREHGHDSLCEYSDDGDFAAGIIALFPDKAAMGDFVNSAKYRINGIVGVALVPAGLTAADYSAELAAVDAERAAGERRAAELAAVNREADATQNRLMGEHFQRKADAEAELARQHREARSRTPTPAAV
jgi:hypothetical protein